MKLFYQSLILGTAFAIAFIWKASPLVDYSIQALGLMIFLFIISSWSKKGFNTTNLFDKRASISIFLLTSIILLLIFSTGGFSSPLFFLLYFLGFGISFVFEPATVFVFAAAVIVLFLQQILQDDIIANMLRAGSFILIAPLAFFFGREYRRDETQEADAQAMKERSEEAAQVISKDVSEVIENNAAKLSEADVAKMNEVLEEAEDLRTESKSSI